MMGGAGWRLIVLRWNWKSYRFGTRGRRLARAFASLHLTSGISLLIILAARWKSFWWRFMCCMIRLTPFTSDDRLRIEMVIWDRQKGQTNRKGFGPAKALVWNGQF